MSSNQFSLMGKQKFLPLFLTQFLGAFHDNLFKNALIVMLMYGMIDSTGYDAKLLVTLAAGLFILPFVLFSALGGQLSDKYPKHKVIRVIKLAEIVIAGFGIASVFVGSIPLAFLTLFLLGAQSAFFGPSKYSILPQQLHKDELIGGNALLNTGTFMAILCGTITGTVLITLGIGKVLVCGIIAVSAITGYLSSRFIPKIEATSPEIVINHNPVSQSYGILRQTFSQHRNVVLSILGASWFYALGSMFMSQFPAFTGTTLHANEQVLAFFLTLFSIGIAIGGLLNNSLLRGRVEATFVPLASLLITGFTVDLYCAGAAMSFAEGAELRGLMAFLSDKTSWRFIVDVLGIAIAGGVYVVPLLSYIQDNTEEKERARIMAGSAISDSLFIIAASALSALLIVKGWEIRELFLAFAVLNGVIALYICKLLPDYLFKTVLKIIFKLFYRVEVRGIENVEKAGKRAVIVGNHVSLLDPPLLAAFLPGRPLFAVNSHVARWKWVSFFLKIVDFFPLDPTNPYSMKGLIAKVQENRHVVIFPEGRLTQTGALMKVYDGPGMIADKADAMILPVRLDGVQHTRFTRLKGKVPLLFFPKITITFLEPRKIAIDEELRGKNRRAMAGKQLYTIMEDMMFLTKDKEHTLYEALLYARYINGNKATIVEDIEMRPISFKRFVQGTILIGRKIKEMTKKTETVGLLLPNSAGHAITFFGLQLFGRVPAVLNFSLGSQPLLSSCKTAHIKTVITSRRFVEMGRLDSLVDALSSKVNIVYLEDIKSSITIWDKVRCIFVSPTMLHKKQKVSSDEPAVVLFTSGSEGMPKGVVLSHKNIMSNIIQLSSRVDFNREDIVFNCLPMFHSFGLTGGTLLPILSGIKTFLYPSPLHYRIVPEMVYSTDATIMFGTDTFLNGYGRMANPYDFYRVRYIFAGAEKIKDETKRLYMERFGVRIFEGYGATETAPVISTNAPLQMKAGSVGRFLSGIEYRLEPVAGVENGGRLIVKGPNVMLGYYRADNPGVIEEPIDGWYDTGDIVNIDEDGFVTILGRAKRFAKIAGEMVSLTRVETMVQDIFPEDSHAVVAIPDVKKGEQLVLVTTRKSVEKSELSKYAKENGITELAVPKTIIEIDKLPVLGSGKTDYPAVQDYVSKQ